MSRMYHIHRLPAKLRFLRQYAVDWIAGLKQAQGEVADFQCNLCGRYSRVPERRIGREVVSCRCGSTVRQRGLIHVLSTRLFGSSLTLPDFPVRKDLVGLDMSGSATYSEVLTRKLDFTNTFLHQEPFLDIVAPAPRWFSSCDFVLSSDVFEHVLAPVSVAFQNAYEILKPGGILVLTVPYTPHGSTVEHFGLLHDFEIVERDGEKVLIDRKPDGTVNEFHDLVFHGGDGSTLEMRVFSLKGLLEEIRAAGFVDVKVHGDPFPQFGIHWPEAWSLPVSAKRPD